MTNHQPLPPTTKSVLSAYKEPLTKVKDGFGYYGTVAFDETQTYTQCHICGYFFEKLGLHTSKQHKMPVKDYREEYGLMARKSLIAPNYRMKYLEWWANLDEKEKKARMEKMRNAQSRNKREWPTKSLEKKNLEGNCPDQLLDKIQKLADKLGRTPTNREYKKEYGSVSPIVATYGTWQNALSILKLDPPKKGGKAQYTEDNVLQMIRDFKTFHGREPYYSDTRGEFLPSGWVMRRLFGNWSKAKQLAFKEANP